MGKMGKIDLHAIKNYQKKFKKLKHPDAFLEASAKELAGRLLRIVIERTPIGEDHSDHTKGELRSGWTIGKIKKEGNIYQIEVINPTPYAVYVEYGHRTANHKGWVSGKFMLTISEEELKTISPRILEKKLKKYLEAQRI